jgi:hypothetical protein
MGTEKAKPESTADLKYSQGVDTTCCLKMAVSLVRFQVLTAASTMFRAVF